MAADADAKRHAALVARRLRKTYGDAECALVHRNPLQLLIATILSAQCTDQRVNLVTPDLFRRYPTAADFAAARRWPTWKRRSKARASFATRPEHPGLLPAAGRTSMAARCRKTWSALVELPGVGRKTANVVLGTAFGIATGVVVDTHVTRLSQPAGPDQAHRRRKKSSAT